MAADEAGEDATTMMAVAVGDTITRAEVDADAVIRMEEAGEEVVVVVETGKTTAPTQVPPPHLLE